ncbi:MAG: hypothetical protein JO023_24015 [Chloroflexi bacterium]|nr:hypothetical protein [Chloroflexota bacterium]
MDQAQQTAGQVTGQATEQATSQLENQKGRLVDTLVTVSQALRQTGQQLNQQEQGTVAGYVERTAEQVDRTTNYLRSHEVRELLADTQDLARREPALFLAGALALGFVGARFLMSSGQRRQQALPAAGGTSGSYGSYGGRQPSSSSLQPTTYPETGVAGTSSGRPGSWGPATATDQSRLSPPDVSEPLGRPEMRGSHGGPAGPLEPPLA